jgi:integrase/recombinase XerD
MSRPVTPRKKKAQPEIGLAIMMREYLNALLVQNYSVNTIENREFLILQFIQWCIERGLAEPVEVTRPVLERYQRYLFLYRKKNGEPMSFRSQHSRLVPLRMWFRWLTRRNHLLHNPASELELPKLGQPLPKNIFSAAEVEQILLLCDVADPIGLRDRAIIEVLYSTGVRRMEVIALKLYDLSLDRGVVLVRQGKGKKDRYVPIGERAVAWLQKYINDMTVFLTAQGEPFNRDHMTSNVKARIDAAKLGKTGACHLFRHTMATLMHENGADIRFIQEILGHVKLETTQIYTHVSIRTLQQVHATTHPAAHLGRNDNLSVKAMSPDAEKLFAVLQSEAEDDAESA